MRFTGPIYLESGNSLIGKPGTIIRASASSDQWFTGNTGIISVKGPVNDVLIDGITIDGNCHNLPPGFANTPGHAHDCERLIVIFGYTNQFSNNITIRNCVFANAFSDAVHVRFAENVLVERNQISNCQHSSVYFVCVINGIVQDNDISGITSDCVRAESSKKIQILRNYLHGYFGPNMNGAYVGGHNLVQVGDQGKSKGYGSDKPIHTENILISGNVFSGKHLNTIWIDAAGKTPTTNLVIENNTFIDMPEIERKGYTWENPPSIEESKEIFTSIHDFLRKDYIFTYPAVEQDFKASATVTFYNNTIQPHSLVEVQAEDFKVVRYEYAGKVAKHFIEKDIWTGELSHAGNDLYIPGKFRPSDLQITIYGESGFQKVENIEIKEEKLASASINPNIIPFILTLAVLAITTYRNLRRIL